MWKCPHCRNTIEKLDYSVPTTRTEYGMAYLNMEPSPEDLSERRRYDIVTDHDWSEDGDNDWDEDPTYRCIECNQDVEINQLIWEETNEEEEHEEIKPVNTNLEEEEHEIIGPKNKIFKTETPEDSTTTSIICKECRNIFIAFGAYEDWSIVKLEDPCECPTCGTSNTVREFKLLLETEFYQTKDDRKKIKHRPVKPVGKSKKPIHS